MILYSLTPSRELTQSGCESSPWGDSDQHAAYILSRANISVVLPYVLLVPILHLGMVEQVIYRDMFSISTNSSPGCGSSGNQTQATHIQTMLAYHQATVALVLYVLICPWMLNRTLCVADGIPNIWSWLMLRWLCTVQLPDWIIKEPEKEPQTPIINWETDLEVKKTF